MPDAEPKFAMLDEAEIVAATLRHDPYDYAFAEQAIFPQFKEEVLADAPKIPDRGSYGLPNLNYGPAFGTVVRIFQSALQAPDGGEIRHRSQQDPAVVLMMGNTTGHYNEGYADPDSKHKIITVIVGFSREWPYERAACACCAAPTATTAPSSSSGIRAHADVPRLRPFLARLPAAERAAHEPAAVLRRFGSLCAQRILAPRRQRLRQISAVDPQGHRLGAACGLTRKESEVDGFPNLPAVDEVARHFGKALSEARRDDEPFRHWLLADVLPYDMCVGVLTLPIAPPVIDDCQGCATGTTTSAASSPRG